MRPFGLGSDKLHFTFLWDCDRTVEISYGYLNENKIFWELDFSEVIVGRKSNLVCYVRQCPRYGIPVCNSWKSLFARLISNLLQFAHLSLLAGLAKDPDPIHAQLLAVSIPINKEDDQRRDILELDKPQIDLRRRRFGIPILGLNRHGLHRRDVIRLVEAKDMRAVGVQLNCLRAHRRLVVVLRRRRKRSHLQRMDLDRRLEGNKEHQLLVRVTLHPVRGSAFLLLPVVTQRGRLRRIEKRLRGAEVAIPVQQLQALGVVLVRDIAVSLGHGGADPAVPAAEITRGLAGAGGVVLVCFIGELADGVGEGFGVCAADGGDGAALLENDEGGHSGETVSIHAFLGICARCGLSNGFDLRCNSICTGNVLLLVNVDLGEGNPVRTRKLFGQLLVRGGDGFAWSAPVCVNFDKIVSSCP